MLNRITVSEKALQKYNKIPKFVLIVLAGCKPYFYNPTQGFAIELDYNWFWLRRFSIQPKTGINIKNHWAV